MNTLNYPACFRGFGRKFVLMALCVAVLALGGCRSSKSVRRDRHRPETEHADVDARNLDRIHGIRRSIVEEVLTWEGTPYRYAAAEKGSGTDCSGLVLRVYEAVAGVKMPRNSAKQAEFCLPVEASKISPGDLVFFATGKDPSRVSHVGVMLSDRLFIHASSKKGVVISDITTPYYQRVFLRFGRVPGI